MTEDGSESGIVNVGALDRPTRDVIVRVARRHVEAECARIGCAAGDVLYMPARRRFEELVRRLSGGATSTPAAYGGTASNVIYHMGMRRLAAEGPASGLWWFGPGLSRWTAQPDAIDALRQVGIVPHVSQASGITTAFCALDEATGESVVTVVHRGAEPRTEPWWPQPDLVVAGADCLARMRSGALAAWAPDAKIALVVDSPGIEARRLRALLRSYGRNVVWLFANHEEATRLRLHEQRGLLAEFGIETVVTTPPSEVAIWTRDGKTLSLPLGASERAASTLGAGDAYAAAFLESRLAGDEHERAHRAAASWSSSVLAVQTARLPTATDLNALFGRRIRRQSKDTDEARLFGRLRAAPGTVVLSGGQTGIDQLGLQAGASLGLPTFAVMPAGRRVDRAPVVDRAASPGLPGDCYVIELSSRSFRYRTWVNAYLADGTLLWDVGGGEGSEETRKACRYLGRPLLEMNGVPRTAQANVAAAWASRHNVRVVNVAGSRARFFPEGLAPAAGLEVERCLAAIAGSVAKAGRHLGEAARPRASAQRSSKGGGSKSPLTIGVSNAPLLRRLLWPGRENGPSKSNALVCIRSDGVRLAFARPRDLPKLLRCGAVDAVVGPSDVFAEARVSAVFVAKTGLFATLTGAVARAGWDVGKLDDAGTTVVSQYPVIARKALRARGSKARLLAIEGTAEAWLELGVGDVAIDTWRTGATANAHGLDLVDRVGLSALVVAVRPGEQAQPHIRSLVDELRATFRLTESSAAAG